MMGGTPVAMPKTATSLGQSPFGTSSSTDGFPGYPEAVDLAFGPYAKYGQIIKDYRNHHITSPVATAPGNGRDGAQGHIRHKRKQRALDLHESRSPIRTE